MIEPSIEKAFNDQLNVELYSAYLYLSMAAFFQSNNLRGMANWMNVQAKEEMTHALKFYNYINESGGKVILQKIDAPPILWKNPLNVFQSSLNHERYVTSLIQKLVSLAEQAKDSSSIDFLQWFVSEQVEEEDNAFQISEKLKKINDDPNAIIMIDKELGSRKFSTNTLD